MGVRSREFDWPDGKSSLLGMKVFTHMYAFPLRMVWRNAGAPVFCSA